MVDPNQLSLEGAIELVPSFAGRSESDLASFLFKCEFIIKSIPDTLKPIILEVIITQLKVMHSRPLGIKTLSPAGMN